MAGKVLRRGGHLGLSDIKGKGKSLNVDIEQDKQQTKKRKEAKKQGLGVSDA